MFSRLKPRTYINFATIHGKKYNWGVGKKNRIIRKSWQEQNNKILERKKKQKILEIKKNNEKFNENKHNNYPVDLNFVNNWKVNTKRNIFLL